MNRRILCDVKIPDLNRTVYFISHVADTIVLDIWRTFFSWAPQPPDSFYYILVVHVTLYPEQGAASAINVTVTH